MKKGNLRLFALVIFTFVISAFVISFASAATPGEVIRGFFSDLFGGLQVGQDQAWIAQALLFVLLTMLIYAISDSIPFLGEKTWVSWVIALIVSALAILFLKPSDVWFILTSYQGMGLALTSIIPLAIVIAFTVKMRSGKFPAAAFINKFVILLFVLFTIYKLATLPPTVPSATSVIYIVSFGLALIWLFAERAVSAMYYKAEFESDADRANMKVRRAILGTDLLSDYASGAAKKGK